MCYESLLNGDATEQPVRSLLSGERRYAIRSGVAAATVTLLALLSGGTGLGLTLASVIGALLLGTALHQAVLLVGVGLLRVWHRRPSGRDVGRGSPRP
ncbi:MAG: hypothetical protein ABEI99_13275 [Halobaculum sp.]